MADQRKTSEIILKYTVDERSLSDADRRAQALLQRFDDLIGNAERTGTAADRAGAGLRDMAGDASRLDNALSDTERASRRTVGALEDSARAVRDYGEEYRRVSQQVESFGDVGTNISAVSGLLRGVGLGGVADVGMLGADVADAVEGIGRLGPAMRDAGERAAAAVSRFVGLEVSLGALSVAGGAVTAVIAAIGVAFALISNEQKKAAESAERFADRLQELNRIIAEGTTTAEARTQRIEQGPELQAAEEDVVQFAELLRGALIDALPGMTEEIQRASTAQLLQTAERLPDFLYGTVNVWEQRLKAAQLALLDAAQTQADLGTLVLDNALAENDAVAQVTRALELRLQAENALANSTSASVQQTIEENERQIAALEEAAGAYAALSDSNTEASIKLEETRQQIDNLREANESLIPVVRQLAELEAKRARGSKDIFELQKVKATPVAIAPIDTSAITNLKSASESRISALNAAFDSFVTNAEKRIADVNNDLSKRTAEMERDYMREALKATEDYLRREKEVREDYERGRVRAIQDMYDSMLSAEESNDVIAFIQAQRAGEKRIQQMDEDAEIEAKRRSEEFVRLQKERREEFKRRLVELQQAAAERIQTIRREIAERRSLLRQQINDERAALLQRLQDAYGAAQQELTIKKAALQTSLTMEAQYAAQKLSLESKLYGNLISLASAAASATTKAYGSTTLSKYPTYSSYSVPVKSVGSTNITVNTGPIGSNLSKTEVEKSIYTAVDSVFTSILKSTAKASSY